MQGKIGLEEHFAIEDTLGNSERYFHPDEWPFFSKRILDLMDLRLQIMDENGMQMMILSLNSPAIQAIYDRKKAVEIAKKANDEKYVQNRLLFRILKAEKLKSFFVK